MKLLIIGGSGLVGGNLLQAAAAAGHAVVGTFQQTALPGLVKLAGSDAGAFEALLEAHSPEAVVHAAGFTWVDGCEDAPERAFEENARQPERMARQCQQRGIRFVYVSTSYVFDGQAGPYDETARPNPINVYSRSKWEGEQRVQNACKGGAVIVRILCVYGAEARMKNFAFQVWRALAEGKRLRLPADQRGNPTFAWDIARWVVALLERRATGVWHLGGPVPRCRRDEWAEMLVQAFTTNGVLRHPDFALEPVSSAVLGQKAARPLEAGMVTDKLASLGMPPTEFGASIGAMLRQQREWFPHVTPPAAAGIPGGDCYRDFK